MLQTITTRHAATLLAFVATVAAASVSQAVKVHSYTFNDSTANDSIGSAHGTLVDPSGIAFYQGGQLRLTGRTFNANAVTPVYQNNPQILLNARQIAIMLAVYGGQHAVIFKFDDFMGRHCCLTAFFALGAWTGLHIQAF